MGFVLVLCMSGVDVEYFLVFWFDELGVEYVFIL